MPPRVTYQLRIDLRRTKPPIWRRVLVPPSMYLDTLHHLIQVVLVAAMGLDEDVRVENEGVAGHGTIFIRRRNLSNVSPRRPVSA